MVGSCKHGMRISGFNKRRKFLNWLKHSAFHGRPCTKKSVVYFPASPVPSQATTVSSFISLLKQIRNNTTYKTSLVFWDFTHCKIPEEWISRLHYSRSQKPHILHAFSSKESVGQEWNDASSFIPHDSFCKSSSIHKLTQHCKMKAHSTTIPPYTHSCLSNHLITCPVDTARQIKPKDKDIWHTQITNKALHMLRRYMWHLIWVNDWLQKPAFFPGRNSP